MTTYNENNQKVLQRHDSNKRIIDAAIDVFSNNGFANSTLANIARIANVSPSLIVQRYESKEKLYLEIVFQLTTLKEILKDSSSLENSLLTLIEEVKKNILLDSPKIRFYSMLLGAKDTPKSLIDGIEEAFNQSVLSKQIIKAQKEEKIIYGEPYQVYLTFLKATIDTISRCYQCSLQVPDNQWFLGLVHYKQENDRSENKHQAFLERVDMIDYFVADYSYIFSINLSNEEMKIYQLNGQDRQWNIDISSLGFSSYKYCYAKKYIETDQQKQFMDNFTKENLDNKFKKHKVFYIQHPITRNNKQYTHQIKVVKINDETIMIGGHDFKENQ